jgi:hypothetical protein
MTAIMYRSFADSQGFNWPPEIAYTVDGKPVTFAEIKAKRVAAQRRHLDSILRCDAPVRRAAFVWTFFVEGPFYGGWHLYLRTIKQKWWIRHYDFPHEALVREIMTRFPCGLKPIPENFYEWKAAFAEQYHRGIARDKQGMAAVWVDVSFSGHPMHISKSYPGDDS